MNHLPSQVPTRIGPLVERLHALYPRMMDLGLDRLQRLLAVLDHPERRLPPIVHVAGTNGKGSTCAMLRAMGEAAGWRVHVFTSPHLVHFNERIRIAGKLVTDAQLAEAMETVERVNDGAAITVFEVIMAAAFHLFAVHEAELCVLEVGLGGRGDATNVIERPAASAITSISLDHQDLLGDTLAAIATEKAGIMRAGVPVATGLQPPEAMAALREAAARTGARLLVRNEDWTIEPMNGGLRFSDARGTIDTPAPSLPGPHQFDNAGIALAALRAGLDVPGAAYGGLARAVWPGRLQHLDGALADLLPKGWELWLDGGHNPGGGAALAAHLATWLDRPLHLVIGMKQSKDVAGFIRPLLPFATSVWAVQEPGQHLAVTVENIMVATGGRAVPGPRVADALRQMSGSPARVLICGSLYLAGEVLKADGTSID